ncbi:hypothetical protein [Gordonia sp. UCD-TK1]|uniref:hypothetical protein n=1 Tax=Gordonia sp. UCD-TK1 TaxID=1857893 RepID=UPI00080E7011|nr:hypothetical protein [Gordonia sp. UCD-TK1]OCH79840.1 hypothetical protein A9310_23390 [Gordonia sp. UCD-TK1]
MSTLADDFPVFGMSDDEALRASRRHPVVAQLRTSMTPYQRAVAGGGELVVQPRRRLSPRASDFPGIAAGILRGQAQPISWERDTWPLAPVYGNTGREPLPWRSGGYSARQLEAHDQKRGVTHVEAARAVAAQTPCVIVHGDTVRGYEVPSDFSPLRTVRFVAEGDQSCFWCVGGHAMSYLLVDCGQWLRCFPSCGRCRSDLDPEFQLDWHLSHDDWFFATGCTSDEWF